MNLTRVALNVNFVERFFTFDPEKDTLADVLRRYGLTGTKVGCRAGQCGACSVIVNGQVVRACVKKMKNVAPLSDIITIEGVGQPGHLHPLQQAWITYGGVQCGFCTPGFIVSAYQLLKENPAPSREEVREWFQEHKNLCRCTGYKPLVDCVMAAAEVMRGEKTMEDITWKMPEDGKIYGTKVPKPTALAKVTGLCDFGDDIGLKMPSATLHLALVMPETSHANVLGIDFSAAEKMPGVVRVITAKDVPGTNKIIAPHGTSRVTVEWPIREVIVSKTIYRYGDVVAVVAARSWEEARAAAKKVKVELEQLPEYLNALDIARAPRLHEGIDNQFCLQPLYKGQNSNGDDASNEEVTSKVKEIFASAPYVVEGSFRSTPEPHLMLEPDTMQAYIDEEGRVTVQCKSQTIYRHKDSIAYALGLAEDQVRIIENPTGATFGAGLNHNSFAIAAACTMVLQQPVTLTMSMAENIHYTGKRATMFSNARLACDEQGKIMALEYDNLFDMGGYHDLAFGMSQKCVCYMGFGYNVPYIRACGRLSFSNFNYCTTYRSFGSPQAYTAFENLVDMMAEKIGMDPFEFRYLNAIRPGDHYISSAPYKLYTVTQLMDMVRPYYEQAKKRAAELSTPEKKRGVGIVVGGYTSVAHNDNAYAALELMPDGSVTNYNSWEQQGQGADAGTLIHTYEALRPLGLPLEKVRMVQNDTLTCPNSGAAAGSRCHYMVGKATLDAAGQLMDAMRKPDGTYRTYDEMVAEGIPTKYLGHGKYRGAINLDPNTGHGDPFPEYMFAVYLCEAEVDIKTGKTKVLSLRSAADVGVIGNRLGCEGQAYGGASHSIGFALQENYTADYKKSSTLKGCGIPDILDIPDGDNFEFMYLETPRPNGPHGSSGASENFQSVGHMAVLHAIYDAVGVRIYELPATPEKVLAAMKANAEGRELKPEKYDFGSTLDEVLYWLKENPI
jgi:aldehyde oxidoreductase